MKTKITVTTHAPHLAKLPPAPAPTFGLGDAVAVVAQPIARAVDKLTGSKLASCSPCAQRHAKMNEIVSDVRKLNPFRRS